MADLPSILGGMAQGFTDFGKGLVDMFGTGGAAIGDLVEGIRTGKVTTKNQDDFRKWLYQTDSVEDAAAKGLGTALNGVQTIIDYIPGVGAVTKNPLFNAGQGALGGLADEFKTYGKDYDLARAGERAAISAGGALASSSLGDALKGTGNPLLSSGTVQGLARGATGGAITAGGYAGIDGGDVLQSALQGAGTGALIGGATGAIQDFKPAKTYDVALTDEEKAARVANIDDQLSKLDTSTPEGSARYNELMGARDNYADNRQAQFDLLQKTNPMRDDYHTGIRSPEDIYTLKSIVDSYNADNNFTYPDFTLADAQKALANGNIDVYSSKPIETGAFISPSKMMATDYAGGGEVYKKNIPLRDFAFIESGDEGNYLPTARTLETTLSAGENAINNAKLTPEQEAFYKNSVMRDANGNLMPMYHSTPNEFTAFDDSRLGQNTAYDNTAFGHFVTNDKDFSSRFKDIDNTGTQGRTMELYANVENPITHPYGAAGKYSGADLDNIVKKYYEALDDPDAIAAIKDWADESGQSLYSAYMDMMLGESPFENAAAERELLKNKGYDAVEFVEGLKKQLVDGSTDTTPVSSYAVFSGNRLKDINNLKPTDNPDIMLSKALPEEVSLEGKLAADDAAINNVDTSKVKKSSNGSISVYTDSLSPETRRALDIIAQRNVPVENELYNRIDPSTLPQGYEKLRDLIDNNVSIDEQVQKKLGKNPLRADVDELLDYLYPNDPLEKRVFHKSLNESIEKYKKDAAALGVDASKAAEDMTRTKRLELIKKIYDDVKFDTIADIGKGIDVGDDLLYATQAYDRRGIRTGYPGALDTALSERLDIAPGNTIKITDSQYDWADDDFKRKNLGRYTRNAKDISVREGISGIEGDISTMAHERLHSFQNEAQPENAGRYSKEVTDAYNELSKDLKPYIKDDDSIAKIYGASDTNYYASPIEQESRMLQTYLDNKGYTKNALYWRNKQNGGNPEWGNEINPAFDKFFNKLRDLSKRGVALPAIAALFGGGAYMASQEKDKEEVK